MNTKAWDDVYAGYVVFDPTCNARGMYLCAEGWCFFRQEALRLTRDQALDYVRLSPNDHLRIEPA